MHLVWHRRDLRVHDHPALRSAMLDGDVAGLVVLTPRLMQDVPPRRRTWTLANVRALRDAYRDHGGELLVRQGPPEDVVPDVVDGIEAYSVHVTRPLTPQERDRDARVADQLKVLVYDHDGHHVHEPGTVTRPEGEPYRAITPYSRRWLEKGLPDVQDAPEDIGTPELPLDPGPIPEVEADVDLPDPGEAAARARLEAFLEDDVHAYHRTRHRLDGAGGSRLSPRFTLGVLSPRLAVRRALLVGGEGARTWVEQLIRRDLHADLLHHEPRLVDDPFARRWADLRWRDDADDLTAWKAGETGVPVVDAAVRQLRETGRLSHRARLVAAQFLTKHLLLPWTWGEETFRQHLLDADLAQSVGNWQRAAGLGFPDAPWSDVLDPVEEARRHDPDGAWLERWCPASDGDPAPLDDAIVDLADARDRYVAEAGRLART